MTATDIPDLFVKEDDQLTLNPDCSWVVDENASPTVMWDGRIVTFTDGQVDGLPADDPELVEAVRRATHYFECAPPTLDEDVKPEECPDPGFCDHPIVKDQELDPLPDGSYTLIGPNINGNPHHLDQHVLKAHTGPEAPNVRVTEEFEYNDTLNPNLATGVKINEDINPQTVEAYFRTNSGVKGLIWTHEDGRKAQALGSDFI